MPLGRHEGGNRAYYEQVVGIGEEADPGDRDGPAVEGAERRIVERFANRPRTGRCSPYASAVRRSHVFPLLCSPLLGEFGLHRARELV